MNIDKTRQWLVASGRKEGAVVHTLVDGKPMRGELIDGEWVLTPEGWEVER